MFELRWAFAFKYNCHVFKPVLIKVIYVLELRVQCLLLIECVSSRYVASSAQLPLKQSWSSNLQEWLTSTLELPKIGYKENPSSPPLTILTKKLVSAIMWLDLPLNELNDVQ